MQTFSQNQAEHFIVKKYLLLKQKGFIGLVAFLSFIGISLGVAALIIVMSVMNGFKDDLLARILGVNSHIAVMPHQGLLENPKDFEKHFTDFKDIKSWTPMIEGQVMVSGAGQTLGALVKGIHLKTLKERALFQKKIEGDFENLDNGSVMIGKRMAENMGLDIGSQITLISPQGKITAFGTIPQSQSYRVGAIFNLGMSEYDKSLIYMPLKAAQSYFDVPYAHGYDMHIANPSKARDFANDMKDKLKGPFQVIPWEKMHGSFAEALTVERNVMFIILTLIIMVAAFNIVSSLIMLVQSKTSDIGILRAMGASRKTIKRIFMRIGLLIGVWGVMLGTVFGVIIALNADTIRTFLENLTGTIFFSEEVYYLSQLPSRLDFFDVVIVAGVSLLFSWASALYPASRAARLHPVEALRTH